MAVTINGSTGISGVDGSAGTPALQGGDTNTGIVFGTDTVGVSTGGVQRTTVDSSGRLLVGVGSANANGGVLQLSGGITFPGTQVAASDVNTLDDYEEGTWTPAVAGTSTAGTATYSVQAGRYTKVGKMIQIQLYVTYSSGTGTGSLKITGLPFTSTEYAPLSIFVNNLTLTASNIAVAYVSNTTAEILFDNNPVGGGSSTAVPYDVSATIITGGCYTI